MSFGILPHHDDRASWRSRFWVRWVLANSTVAGLFALLWLILRTGSRPSRLAYPCQQAAFSAATLAFGAPLIAALTAVRRGTLARLRPPVVAAAAGLCLLAAVGAWAYRAQPDPAALPVLDPPVDYVATVFQVTDCPPEPVGDSFPGLDNLLILMGRHGLKLHRSPAVSTLSGPDGIIGADDVVVLKINYQWEARGGTNTDLLRGLIHRIVGHPDGFSGEVVVCENSQVQPLDGFDRAANNSADLFQSPLDVVNDFADDGYAVSAYSWTSIRRRSADEFSEGDDDGGYVVYGYDPALHGRVSYPKFTTAHGTRISLRDGIWDPGAAAYDRDRLKVINLPVLKSHSASYGGTACVKNYMGVVTNSLNTNSHDGIAYGLLGEAMAVVRPPDLNILDSIWINANPNDGPWTSYAGATRADQLVASTDPVAADIWAVTNILVPAFLANGYEPPWPNPEITPDDPGSEFRVYLDNSMSRLLAAGYQVTNRLDSIELVSWDGTPQLDRPRRPLGRVASP